MFVLRSRDRHIVTSNEWGKEEEELQHETYLQAQKALEEMELSLPKGLFQIEPIQCERCGGDQDLAIIHINNDPKGYCQNCRVEMFSKKNPVGRPPVGVTKKVSLTLPAEEWEWLDDEAKDNRSLFLRQLVWKAQSKESEWNNYACLGYAVTAAEKIGYDAEKISELVRVIYGEFDLKSVPEAEDIYRKSDY